MASVTSAAQSEPIALVDDRALATRGWAAHLAKSPTSCPGGAFTSRFSVMFEAPGTEMKHATLVIPFVELNDFAPSTTVTYAQRRWMLSSADITSRRRGRAVRDDQRRIVLELRSPGRHLASCSPRVHGADPEFGWQRHAFDANAPGRPADLDATKCRDPPIVTFTGVVLRLDGPLELELPLG